ncbi:AraC family transcriptional regulator ligand-binding domain-containing protein [Nocardia lijiangensis]|uniref:AraC family transcriptional regulator n=1 Tax=Nocardia lijiangensis TaxID=299618 RepID=UPI003D73948D
MAWVRSAGLRGVRAVVEQLGGDADALARRANAPDGALDDDELMVRDSTIATILESAARELHCPDFGLRVALEQDLSMLGPLAVALQNAPTAADALDYTAKYLFVHARNLSVRLVPDPRGSRAVVGVRYGYPDGVQAPPQSIDMGLLFLHRVLISLFDGSYGLRTVEIPHRPVAPRRRYEELFSTQVHWQQPAAVLRVPKDLPQRTIEGGDRTTRLLALSYLDSQTPAAGSAIAGRVKAALQQSLGTGPTTIAAVADLLSISPRSLQRHLAAEGKSFATVLDDVRRERASTLLTESDLPLAQIASTIGLHNPATLSRYARRWWGTTARNVRREATGTTATSRRTASSSKSSKRTLNASATRTPSST